MDSTIPTEPSLATSADSPVQTVIVPRTRDLGGFEVRRALPTLQRRMVGPFVFLDQMGPAVFHDGRGLDVRPHPHIGLATVTYLFEGEILHRDSLGTVQAIRPGAVNWMTAGRGIVHSERTPAEGRVEGARLSGVQTWVALPRAHEEAPPSFAHTPAEALPAVEGDGVRLRVIAGALHGARSPVPVLSETLYADAALAPGARLEIPAEHEERAVLVAEGAVEVAGERHGAGRLLVLRAGRPAVVRALEPARLMVLGGDAMDGPRHVWWNFVGSSAERIEEAARAWSEGRFPAVPGESESIPLPSIPRLARYP
ncbi:MAG TPA: pirin family protein [Anaeromyxobacteraceae bacterium]|nr:pirin family protein [Anaeromyxobacteraceae bacterium]